MRSILRRKYTEIWPQFWLFRVTIVSNNECIYVGTHRFLFPVVVFVISILKQAMTSRACPETDEAAWSSGGIEGTGGEREADIEMG